MAANHLLSECPSCRMKNKIPVSRIAGAPRCGSCKGEIEVGDWYSTEPVELTDAAFTTLIQRSKRPVLADFWAPWCSPCRQLAPHLEDLARRYGNDLLIVKVNVDQNPAVASAMGIASIPSLVLFNGGKVVNRMVGALPKQQLEAWLNHALGLTALRH